MTVAEKVLNFYKKLHIDDTSLPKEVAVLNPYQQPAPAKESALQDFYHKYYNDQHSRGLILGINPGRFGAGITGIPFTDSYRLREFCGIHFPTDTRETSSVFVYDVIKAFGGANAFYSKWLIGAVSPLGFIHKNAKGNWVNYNYYDDPDLEKAVRPFIISKLKEQRDICGKPKKCVVWGTGKNYSYLRKLNKEIQLFEEIIPLEHPRYIMQYKQKEKVQYVAKFLEVLA